MIEPKDVPLWLMERGVGHIVMASDTRWHHTPHSLVICGRTQKTIPKRICQECREAMQRITKPQ